MNGVRIGTRRTGNEPRRTLLVVFVLARYLLFSLPLLKPALPPARRDAEAHSRLRHSASFRLLFFAALLLTDSTSKATAVPAKESRTVRQPLSPVPP
jgi:hypothetical protein